jgi:hypothetical protein
MGIAIGISCWLQATIASFVVINARVQQHGSAVQRPADHRSRKAARRFRRSSGSAHQGPITAMAVFGSGHHGGFSGGERGGGGHPT